MQENDHKGSILEFARKRAVDRLVFLDSRFEYHNLDHTRQVVEAAEEIGSKSGLSNLDMENLLIAAWFHDTGYSCCIENHERESSRIMREELAGKINETRLREIEEVIMSTQMPQRPKNLVSEILCDADLYHLSDPDFTEKSESLRRELNKVCNKKLDKYEWIRVSLQFIKEHCYFTAYGRKYLRPRKIALIEQIKSKFSAGTHI
jgi:predicted metal-dependent HD superfamily phosphohydrolase